MPDKDLQTADEQMTYYWNREWSADADLDTQQRIVELLQVVAHASISIARNLEKLARNA